MRPANETKGEKFKRLAEARTNKIAHLLKLIGNLSNKMNYEYDNEQVEKMFSYLQEQLDMAKQQYNESNGGKRVVFSLKDRGQ